MKREIKFKAIGKESNQWEFFNIVESIVIAPIQFIIPETLCQSTGLKDKEGNDYYEGDIPDHNEPIVFRDGCFFSGHIPLALLAENRKIVGNVYDEKLKSNSIQDESKKL
jgi:hypothetical protein